MHVPTAIGSRLSQANIWSRLIVHFTLWNFQTRAQRHGQSVEVEIIKVTLDYWCQRLYRFRAMTRENAHHTIEVRACLV
jgi:hypothetical protein